MPPKATNQKGARRAAVANDPVVVASVMVASKKTKSRASESRVTKSRRNKQEDEDSVIEVNEDDDSDTMGSQEVKNTAVIRKLIANQFSKNDNAKTIELQKSIAGMFAEARLASEGRKRECSQYLEAMVLDFEERLKERTDPEIEEILRALEKRNTCVLNLGMQDEPLSGPVKERLEAAVAETTQSLNDHEQLRTRSRKRLLKHAKGDYRLAAERQKLATDAHAYIKYYKRLIVL